MTISKGVLSKIRIAINNGKGEAKEIANSINITTWAEADMFMSLYGAVQRDVYIEWSNDHGILASVMPDTKKISLRNFMIERLEEEAGYRCPEYITMEAYEHYANTHPENVKSALFTLKSCDFGVPTRAMDNPAFLIDIDENQVIIFSDIKTVEKKELEIIDSFSKLNESADDGWEIHHPNIAVLDAENLPPIEICKCINIPGYSEHILKLIHANESTISHT